MQPARSLPMSVPCQIAQTYHDQMLIPLSISNGGFSLLKFFVIVACTHHWPDKEQPDHTGSKDAGVQVVRLVVWCFSFFFWAPLPLRPLLVG